MLNGVDHFVFAHIRGIELGLNEAELFLDDRRLRRFGGQRHFDFNPVRALRTPDEVAKPERIDAFLQRFHHVFRQVRIGIGGGLNCVDEADAADHVDAGAEIGLLNRRQVGVGQSSGRAPENGQERTHQNDENEGDAA